jgi:membrane associated rhomboid family serine protease
MNDRAMPRSAIPTETALLWGLLGDLLCAPLWLYRILRGQAAPQIFLRPLYRIAAFASAARMTAALILANLLGFAIELGARLCLSEAAFLRRFTLVPADLQKGHLLPLLTHLFAHASPVHLLGNMLTLFVFGRIVERHLGPLRTLLTYLGAASVSTALSLAAQVALHKSVPTLGASGAIAGLVALGILFEPFAITFEALLPMPVFLLGWLAVAADLSGVLSGRHDGIDHFAHLGGYLSVLAAFALLDPDQRRKVRLGLWLNLATAGLAVTFWLILD